MTSTETENKKVIYNIFGGKFLIPYWLSIWGTGIKDLDIKIFSEYTTHLELFHL